MQKIRQGNWSQTAFLFFLKKFILGKSNLSTAWFHFLSIALKEHTTERNCLKFYKIDPEICSILIFYVRIREEFLHHILHIIFQQKCSWCSILLTDQISLPGCLYFLTYWGTGVLQLVFFQVAIVFFPGCDLMDFEINLFLIELFFLDNQKVMKKSDREWK